MDEVELNTFRTETASLFKQWGVNILPEEKYYKVTEGIHNVDVDIIPRSPEDILIDDIPETPKTPKTKLSSLRSKLMNAYNNLRIFNKKIHKEAYDNNTTEAEFNEFKEDRGKIILLLENAYDDVRTFTGGKPSKKLSKRRTKKPSKKSTKKLSKNSTKKSKAKKSKKSKKSTKRRTKKLSQKTTKKSKAKKSKKSTKRRTKKPSQKTTKKSKAKKSKKPTKKSSKNTKKRN